jgi:hypothetical protein
MRKNLFSIIFLAFLICSSLTSVYTYEAFYGQTELADKGE